MTTDKKFHDPTPWVNPEDDKRYPSPYVDGEPLQGMEFMPRSRKEYEKYTAKNR